MSVPHVLATLEATFLAAHLRVQRAWPLTTAALSFDLFASGPAAGKLFGVIGWDHYFFVADADRCGLHARDRLDAVHQSARRHVNGLYSFPPALRLTLPTIASVAVSAAGFHPTLVEYVRSTDHATFIGGEANVMILVDLPRRAVVVHDHHSKSRIASPALGVNQLVAEACRPVFGVG